MPTFSQLVTLMREQMNATLSRSDVLKPLAWLIGMLATATAVALFARPHEWVLTWLLVLLAGAVILYALSYSVLLFIDRDALRSERYSLQKLALEQGVYGDSVAGIIEQPQTQAVTMLPAQTPPEPKEKTESAL